MDILLGPPTFSSRSSAFDVADTALFRHSTLIHNQRNDDGNHHSVDYGSDVQAMTNDAVKEMTGDREIKNADTLDFSKGMQEVKGGLFDPALTGGRAGNLWSHIKLAEPMLNPVMEDPARRLLGLTKQKFEDVIAGKEKLIFNDKTGTGPQAIAQALAAIDIPRELLRARSDIAGTRKTARDDAIKRLGYLKDAQRMEIHPKDWVLDRVPVLPPKYRQISLMQGTKLPIVADANYMYRQILEANDNLKKLRDKVDDVGEEHLALYHSFKASSGLMDPLHPQLREKNVGGILANIFGSSPKHGTVQARLLSNTVDMVGRAVITPNPDLDMDHIGIPENSAWNMYKNFVVRRLVRKGMPLSEAARQATEKTPLARKELLAEMDVRPVYASRAPTLHRFGFMAFWPRLTKTHTIQISPLSAHCLAFSTPIGLELDIRTLSASRGGRIWLSALESNYRRLTGNELMALAANRRLSVVLPIGELPQVGIRQQDRNGAEVWRVPNGVAVCSYSHSDAMACLSEVRHFTIHRRSPCVRVETARHRIIEVSGAESLAVFDSNTGELVRRTVRASLGALTPWIKQEPILGTEFTREYGWWYGALISDGWLQNTMVGYAKNDPAKRAEFIRLAGELFTRDFTAHEYLDDGASATKFAPSAKVHLFGRALRDLISNCYAIRQEGRGALYKRIPQELLSRGSRECLLGLLAGLFDGDQSLGWNHAQRAPRGVCKTHTSSPFLVEDLKRLGRLLGIRLSITITPARGRSQQSYTVCWSLVDISGLAGELRLIGASGQCWLNEIQERAPTKDNIDIVPAWGEIVGLVSPLLVARKEMTLYSAFRKALTAHSVGRDSARRVVQLLNDWLINDPQWRRFSAIVSNEKIHWDRIEAIREIEPQDVYDLDVPSTNVFMIQNGIIVWGASTATCHPPIESALVNSPSISIPAASG